MNVGILGSGVVAQTLGRGFIDRGLSVMSGTREPAKLQDWAKQAKAKVGSFAEAASFGDLVVLAVKGSAAETVVKSAGAGLANKVLMATTNPIADAAPQNGVLSFFTTLEKSLMERLQAARPDVKF